MRVEAIYIAPVKSLALVRVERAQIGERGIVEDRRFFLVNERGRLVTQREAGKLAQVRAEYTFEPERLRLTFPDGRVVEGAPADGAVVTARFFGKRDVGGHVVEGGWAEALSAFAGMALRLVRADDFAQDGFPISICSAESVEMLRSTSGESNIDERRFRPNIYVSGAGAHGEDEWIGGEVGIGASAVVRVVMRDERCVMTTLDPSTGERDLNTLRLIAAYRTDQPKQVNFGVYASVVTPGVVSVGDEILVNSG